MLLVHTTGTTKIGDVRRYTITYTPSQDRILPLPTALFLRIKNTASLPLRAAYLHGPYTLYVSVRRKEYEPWPSNTPGSSELEREVEGEADHHGGEENEVEDPEAIAPIYEPHLKAGASFYATLPVPKRLRDAVMEDFHARKSFEYGGRNSLDESKHFVEPKKQPEPKRKSVTWIIEIVSQVIFSTSATVPYELLLGRDEKSLSFGYPFGPNNQARPGSSEGMVRDDGVLSYSVKLRLQDTQELWNTPPFPRWDDKVSDDEISQNPEDQDEARDRRRKRRSERKQKKVHLVVITHGLHSNTGADMLFIKESIDAEERKAAALRRARRKKELAEGKKTAEQIAAEEEEDEQVLVRGYQDNACNTERGIKFLGKRLAKWILHTARPHDHAPPRTQASNKLTKKKPAASHHHPHLTPAAFDVFQHLKHDEPSPWKVTSISFIGHSLGGLIQVYAIAFIHAHHPHFFTETKPVNFVAMATPFLGLSNENPLYVKFALDFGLVGRTGQDLGLTWRAPNAFSNFTSSAAAKAKAKAGGKDNSSKPLLRILPTGPAHEVLKMFRNRTVYANVVNDGIVPLRTSCLLFLDWKGLGRVEKARRENGTVSGLVEWGIGQLVTGPPARGIPKVSNTTSSTAVTAVPNTNGFSNWSSGFWGGSSTAVGAGKATNSSTETVVEDQSKAATRITEGPLTKEPSPVSLNQTSTSSSGASIPNPASKASNSSASAGTDSPKGGPHPFSSLMTLLRPHAGRMYSTSGNSTHSTSSDLAKIAMPPPAKTSGRSTSPTHPHSTSKKSSKIYSRSQTASTATSPVPTPTTVPSTPTIASPSPASSPPPSPPPKTTIFEAASDVLNPPLPTMDFLLKPSERPRTIFHERVYHAKDIPPIPESSSDISVEEKIARAYHRDMAWRKVLVRLEPDAHNNINVRRMFSNAYGWPVVQHLVETHFGESYAARTRDEEETAAERVIFPGDAHTTQVGLGLGELGKPDAAAKSTLNAPTAPAGPRASEKREKVPAPDAANGDGDGGQSEDAAAAALSVVSGASPLGAAMELGAKAGAGSASPQGTITPTQIAGNASSTSVASKVSDPDSAAWSASAWHVTDDEDSGPDSPPHERGKKASVPTSPSTFAQHSFSPLFGGFQNPFSSASLSASVPNSPKVGFEGDGAGDDDARAKRRSSGVVGVERVVGVGLSAGPRGMGFADEGGAVKMLERCHSGGARGEVRRVRGWEGER